MQHNINRRTWQQVADALSRRDPKALAALSTASGHMRKMTAVDLNSTARNVIKTSAVVSEEPRGSLTETEVDLLLDFAKEAREFLFNNGIDHAISPVDLMALSLVMLRSDSTFLPVRLGTKYHLNEDRTRMLSKLPRSWGEWAKAHTRDVVEFVNHYHEEEGTGGELANYDARFLLGAKAISAWLSKTPKHADDHELALVTEALSPSNLRRTHRVLGTLIGHGFGIQADNALEYLHFLHLGLNWDSSMPRITFSVLQLIYKASELFFGIPAPANADTNMDLAAAIHRQNGAHGLKTALKRVHAMEPSIRDVVKVRRAIGTGIAHVLGFEASKKDEYDALRVLYVATVFLMQACEVGYHDSDFEYITYEGFIKSRDEFLSNWKLECDLLFSDAKALSMDAWESTTTRSFKVMEDVRWAHKKPNDLIQAFRTLRPLIMGSPLAPVRFYEDPKFHGRWVVDPLRYSNQIYAFCLRGTIVAFFTVLQRLHRQRESLQPFSKSQWVLKPAAGAHGDIYSYFQLANAMDRHSRKHQGKTR